MASNADATANNGQCTLREAIINANNDAATWPDCAAGTGADIISFSVAGTITLAASLPNITDIDGLTINGGGAITVSGNNLFRIMTVNAGVPAAIQNMILTNGSVNGSGGAISNNGNLTLTNVSFTNNITITNVANDGGAINQAAGTLTVTNSTFTGNYTQDNGGAIYVAGGTVNITGSTFLNNNNALTDDGGAIYINAGAVTITNSTFTANGCNEEGGAIFKNGGTLVINGNSLFDGNISVNDGGGLYAIDAGNTTITNSTFQNHTNAGINNGGALYFSTGTLNISGSAFTGNRAPLNLGGAIYFASGTGTVSNTSFTNNSSQTNGGAIYKNGGNLTINNNSLFDGNYSLTNGGAIYSANLGMLDITSVMFQNQNNANIDNGGALYFTAGTLNISGSTFTGNRAPLNLGGAIYFASGTGTISNTIFTGNNSQTNGGAIYKNSGDLTINNNSLFDGNYSLANGGAIYAAANLGTLAIANSTFQNHNNANIDSGGAIFFNTGALNITGSTFSGNHAQDAGDQGGAVYINSGTVTISDTDFLNNIADTYGGAVRVNGGTVTINTTSTFTGNTANLNDGGAIYMATGTVNVSDATFTNNFAVNDGGAIAVASGTLTLTNATFNGNRADDGGAIYHNAATLLNVTNSTFAGNLANGEADGDGGALTMNSAAAGSSATITGSSFSNNIANDDGGSLWLASEPVTITGSTFNNNQALGGNLTSEGGAIYTTNAADATSIRLSTFTNNSATATANVNVLGGAISNAGTGFILANSTFSGNSVTKTAAGAGNAQGGAVYTAVVAADTTTIHNVTFNGNSATENGTGTADGGSLFRQAGTVTVANTILANSTENGVAGNCGGTITNGGNNIHFNGADCGAGFTNVNPDLGALTGSPAYFPLNLTSPAINAGSNIVCANAATTNNQSQNGVTRPAGVNCDISSYEMPDPPPTVLSITRVNPSPTNLASVDFTVTFSESVTGGAASNFTLTTSGVAGASITGVSAGPGATRTVTVNTGTGNGTIRLDMVNSTGVGDTGGNSVSNLPYINGETYTIDKTPLAVTINQAAAQPDPTNAAPVNFTVVFSETVADFTTGDVSFTGSTVGGILVGTVTGGPSTYNVAVTGMTSDGVVVASIPAGVAQDAAGNGNTASTSTDNTVTYDTTPPDTTINSGPADPSADNNPAFGFSGNDGGGSGVAGFECQMDGGGYSACTSGSTIGLLSDGLHTFEVRAIDNTGNVDPSPASYTWTIDSVPPDTTIDSNPANPSTDNNPVFAFSGNDGGGTGVAGFECQMDGGGYSPCISGSTFGPLVDGSHTFEVHAVDAAGNVDPTPASYTWTIDTTPPDTAITSNPPSPSNDPSPTFSFTGDDGTGTGVASFECQVDGGGYSACTSGSSFGPLGSGLHTFQVRAIDNMGLVDATPASYTWTVDLAYPIVLFTANTTPSSGSVLTTGPIQSTIEYSKDVKNDGSAGAANNIVNYLLVEDGANNTFDTLSCLGGLVADDTPITIDSASYINNGGIGPFVATININGGVPLPVGTYRFFICGTTSIEDLVGNELNDGLSDTTLDFTVIALGGGLPTTGFPMGEVTHLPAQPASLTYDSYSDLWLEIPKLGLKTDIVGVPLAKDGWNTTWLGRNAGWLNGTAFPTWEGNSVITAHVWDAFNNPGPFARLRDLRSGDQIKIHAFGQVFIYEILVTRRISPKDNTSVFKHEENAWITLLTCEDYKILSKTYSFRRMVRALLIRIDPGE